MPNVIGPDWGEQVASILMQGGAWEQQKGLQRSKQAHEKVLAQYEAQQKGLNETLGALFDTLKKRVESGQPVTEADQQLLDVLNSAWKARLGMPQSSPDIFTPDSVNKMFTGKSRSENAAAKRDEIASDILTEGGPPTATEVETATILGGQQPTEVTTRRAAQERTMGKSWADKAAAGLLRTPAEREEDVVALATEAFKQGHPAGELTEAIPGAAALPPGLSPEQEASNALIWQKIEESKSRSEYLRASSDAAREKLKEEGRDDLFQTIGLALRASTLTEKADEQYEIIAAVFKMLEDAGVDFPYTVESVRNPTVLGQFKEWIENFMGGLITKVPGVKSTIEGTPEDWLYQTDFNYLLDLKKKAEKEQQTGEGINPLDAAVMALGQEEEY